VVHGFTTASGVAAGIVVGGAVIVALLMNTGKSDASQLSAEAPKTVHM
jgi:hypothetical protein